MAWGTALGHLSSVRAVDLVALFPLWLVLSEPWFVPGSGRLSLGNFKMLRHKWGRRGCRPSVHLERVALINNLSACRFSEEHKALSPAWGGRGGHGNAVRLPQ